MNEHRDGAAHCTAEIGGREVQALQMPTRRALDLPVPFFKRSTPATDTEQQKDGTVASTSAKLAPCRPVGLRRLVELAPLLEVSSSGQSPSNGEEHHCGTSVNGTQKSHKNSVSLSWAEANFSTKEADALVSEFLLGHTSM